MSSTTVEPWQHPYHGEEMSKIDRAIAAIGECIDIVQTAPCVDCGRELKDCQCPPVGCETYQASVNKGVF